VAVICGDETVSYATLYQRAEARAATLPHGEVVVFRCSQTIEFLVTYFAIHLAGSVAAPLERDTPEPLFQEITASLVGSVLPADSADIHYTTGTTGRSKGVIVSHPTIIADAENLIAGQGFSRDLLFIINGPLNHLGSLSKLFPVMLLGATLYILDGMRDLNAFFRALDYPAPKIATFFVPATIRMLLQFGAERLAHYADKIDFIESGAAPLAHSDMLRLCELLPHTRLYNTYASTETGIIATYNFNDGRCLQGCLGRPMPHSRIVITNDGLISCQGDTLMTGYVNDPELTATILRDNTIFTSDIGHIDEEGMLRLEGRQGDVINVGGYKVAPTEVEDAALSLPEVKDCICISVEHPVMGHALKLLVVLAEGHPFNKRQLALALKDRLETYKVPLLYEQIEKVQRTYNGKIDRKFYFFMKES
jgi:acyl-CoA synthetase (AMP-forming)/AMP-acid ligase II